MRIPASYAQINFMFSGLALPTGAQCTLGIDVSEFGGTPADAGAIIATEWGDANFDNLQIVTVALASVLVKFGPNNVGPAAETAVNDSGAESAQGLPPMVAALVQKNTESGGRQGRGRLYFPGIPENQVDEAGVLSSTWVTDLGAAWNAFGTAMSSADMPPVLLHAGPLSEPEPFPITSFAVSTQIATQRRRNRR